MRVQISWTTHARKYTVDLLEFLATMGIESSEEEIRAAARKLLEQNEAKPE